MLKAEMKILKVKVYIFWKIPAEIKERGDVQSPILDMVPGEFCLDTGKGAEITFINDDPTEKIDGIMFELFVSRDNKEYPILSAPFIRNAKTESFDKRELGEWDIPTGLISAVEYEDIHEPLFCHRFLHFFP